jgi:hypothetical protein
MSQMKTKILIPALIALMGVSAGAWADDDDDGAEATIRLMDVAEAELPGAVTNTISLPDHLQVEDGDQVAAVEKAKNGHDQANKRLESENRQKGLSQAEAARENGKELTEKATEARENHGRADPPGRPESPGRPENPGNR